MPEEIVEAHKSIRFIVQRIEASVANHEFGKARFYSVEERKERDNLKLLCEKYKLQNSPALNVGRKEIEQAIIKLVGSSADSGLTTS